MFECIRRDRRDEDLSVRALADRYRVHRRTVRQALADAMPPQRRRPTRVAPALGPYKATVRGWLIEDREAPRKQRHTARRVWQRLVEEQGADVSESTVRAFVAEVRRELGTGTSLVSVPQTHLPAAEAEVDFGEFRAWIGGTLVKLWMFVLRLSYSGKTVHVAYANQTQESFFDGFITALAVLGGVPGRVRLDNLTPAVIRVLLGRERLENQRFVALRSHFGFDVFYCIPGLEGAHEKGGVEGEVGRFRRRHLTPVPRVESLAELNELIAAADRADDVRRVAARVQTVGQAAALELPLLRPLPVGCFDADASLSCRVDSKARICVRQSYYSVPVSLAARRVTVRLGARQVRAFDGARLVATHVRALHKGSEDLQLDHYLEVLVRKPGALPGSTALAQARAAGTFTADHQRYWDTARRELGDGAGTRALIAVLLLHRVMPAAAVLAGIGSARAAGRVDADLVAVEARRHLEHDSVRSAAAAATSAGEVVTIPVPGEQARAVPALHGYDELLAAGGAR